eukprot:3428881-Pyramimonas_sp.AAC.1
MVISGSEMYELLLGKGARAFGWIKTPSGHVALKVDECGGPQLRTKGRYCLLSRQILTAKGPVTRQARRQLIQSQSRGNLHRAVWGPAM